MRHCGGFGLDGTDGQCTRCCSYTVRPRVAEKSARKTSSLPESSGALADAAATANATRPINTPAVRSAFIVRIYAVLGSAAV